MPRSNTPADFWARVKRGDPDECWLWTGPLTDRGYGKTHYGGKEMRAHQVAFLLENGYQPPATLHRCDVRGCCNPKHLFAGDNGLNNKDRAAKGRSWRPKGSDHPASQLTREDVERIREAHLFGASLADLARAYGLSRSYPGQIVQKDRWSHL